MLLFIQLKLNVTRSQLSHLEDATSGSVEKAQTYEQSVKVLRHWAFTNLKKTIDRSLVSFKGFVSMIKGTIRSLCKGALTGVKFPSVQDASRALPFVHKFTVEDSNIDMVDLPLNLAAITPTVASHRSNKRVCSVKSKYVDHHAAKSSKGLDVGSGEDSVVSASRVNDDELGESDVSNDEISAVTAQSSSADNASSHRVTNNSKRRPLNVLRSKPLPSSSDNNEDVEFLSFTANKVSRTQDQHSEFSVPLQTQSQIQSQVPLEAQPRFLKNGKAGHQAGDVIQFPLQPSGARFLGVVHLQNGSFEAKYLPVTQQRKDAGTEGSADASLSRLDEVMKSFELLTAEKKQANNSSVLPAGNSFAEVDEEYVDEEEEGTEDNLGLWIFVVVFSFICVDLFTSSLCIHNCSYIFCACVQSLISDY